LHPFGFGDFGGLSAIVARDPDAAVESAGGSGGAAPAPEGIKGGTSAGFSAGAGRDGSSAVEAGVGVFSSQTSSMRQPLNRLLTIIVSPCSWRFCGLSGRKSEACYRAHAIRRQVVASYDFPMLILTALKRLLDRRVCPNTARNTGPKWDGPRFLPPPIHCDRLGASR